MFKAIFRKIKNRFYMFVHRKKNNEAKEKETAKKRDWFVSTVSCYTNCFTNNWQFYKNSTNDYQGMIPVFHEDHTFSLFWAIYHSLMGCLARDIRAIDERRSFHSTKKAFWCIDCIWDMRNKKFFLTSWNQ